MRLINQKFSRSLNWMLHDSCVFVEDTIFFNAKKNIRISCSWVLDHILLSLRNSDLKS